MIEVLLILLVILVSALAILKHVSRRGMLQLARKYVTMNGEVVKSYGEKAIADYFYTRGIRYQYERPFYGYDERGRRRRLSRPDFYLPDFKTYVEYFGMVDSPDQQTRKRYREQVMWKVDRHIANDARLIPVFPQDLRRLDSVFGFER